MKRPWIKRKDFHNFHWTKRTSSRRGHEKLKGEEFLGLVFCFLRRRGKLVVMCEEVLFMEENV
jgi:hypothetical protein